MRQEVNLYTPEFRRVDQPLSSRWMVRVALAFFVALMLVEALTAWQLVSGRNQLNELNRQQQAAATRVEALRQSRPLGERARLEQQVEDLQAQVHRRQELRAIISGKKLGNFHGFSPFMESMARQASSDISLSEIRLLNGGDYLELGGWVRSPEAVPRYLRKLRDERSFQQVKFGTLVIERDEGEQLQFRLGKPEEGSS